MADVTYTCDGGPLGLGGFTTSDAEEAEEASHAGYIVTAVAQ